MLTRRVLVAGFLATAILVALQTPSYAQEGGQQLPVSRIAEELKRLFFERFNDNPILAIGEVVDSAIDRRLEALERQRYILVATQNERTFLELDTATGRIWQVHFRTNPTGTLGRIAVNEESLVPIGELLWPGRFVLYPTTNFWNFLLLDQSDGRVWQVQFSLDDAAYRWIRPIPDID